MIKIHGVPFSAHARKVIVTALEKSLSFDLDPVIPLDPPEGWHEKSPLGLIPVIEDGGFVLADSSVIAQYLERQYPEPAFYPKDPRTLARALWIEEFVDGGLAPHVLRGLLFERVLAPLFFDRPADEAVIRQSLEEAIPPRLDYLETTLEGDWFAGPDFSIGDVAVASILINYHLAGESLDASKHPKLDAFLDRALARKSFRQAFEGERPAAESVEHFDLSVYARGQA